MSNSIYIKEDLVKSHHHANRYIKFINYARSSYTSVRCRIDKNI